MALCRSFDDQCGARPCRPSGRHRPCLQSSHPWCGAPPVCETSLIPGSWCRRFNTASLDKEGAQDGGTLHNSFGPASSFVVSTESNRAVQYWYPFLLNTADAKMSAVLIPDQNALSVPRSWPARHRHSVHRFPPVNAFLQLNDQGQATLDSSNFSLTAHTGQCSTRAMLLCLRRRPSSSPEIL